MEKIQSYILNSLGVAYDQEGLSVLNLLGKLTNRVNGLIDNLDYNVKESIEKLDLNVSDLVKLKDKTKDIFNVLEYGAKPNDVMIDNTSAIQQAINKAYENGGGTVLLPKGNYYVKNTIELKPYVKIQGVGSNHLDGDDFGSVITYNGTTNIPILQGEKSISETYYRWGVSIEDLQIRSDGDFGTGIKLSKCGHTKIKNVCLEFLNIGMEITGGMLDLYENVNIRYCKSYGLLYTNTSQSTTQYWHKCYIGQHRLYTSCIPLKIYEHAGIDFTFDKCTFESNHKSIELGMAIKCNFINCYFENSPITDNDLFLLGTHYSDDFANDNHHGNFNFTNSHFQCMNTYTSKNLFRLVRGDILNLTNCFITRVESIYIKETDSKAKVLMISSTCENGLITNKFSSYKDATIISCIEGSRVLVNNTPKEIISVPLENSWTNVGNGHKDFTVIKEGNLVHVEGVVSGGTSATITTLPVSLRSGKKNVIPCIMINEGVATIYPININIDGTITVTNALRNTTYLNFTYEI